MKALEVFKRWFTKLNTKRKGVATIKVGLQTDFRDYYDGLFWKAEQADIVFKRMMKDNIAFHKGIELLHKIGVNALELKAVREINAEDDESVIVYMQDNSTQIMGKQSASILYPNHLCSKQYDTSRKHKLVYVGNRRFAYNCQTAETRELSSMHNRYIREPIFSIEYAETDNGLLALKLNTVENLSQLNIHHLMSEREVLSAIVSKLI